MYKVLKVRGRFVKYVSLPYVVAQEGLVIIEPLGEAKQPPETGSPQARRSLTKRLEAGS
jgi:hypothetical protein